MVREISPSVPRVTIVVEPAGARAAASVTINGEPIDRSLLGGPLARDPGELDVRAEAPGYLPARGSARLAARDNQRVVLVMTASPAGTLEGQHAARSISPLLWVGAGVAVASAAVAIGLGVAGNGVLNDYETLCVGAMPQGDCAARQGMVQESLDGRALAVNVAWGIAGAGLVAMGIGLITTLTGSSASPTRPTASVSWGIMPGGATMRMIW